MDIMGELDWTRADMTRQHLCLNLMPGKGTEHGRYFDHGDDLILDLGYRISDVLLSRH